MVHARSGVCVKASQSAKYLPDKLNVHMVAYATCTAGPAAFVSGSNQNPINIPEPPPVLTSPPPEPVEVPPTANGVPFPCMLTMFTNNPAQAVSESNCR